MSGKKSAVKVTTQKSQPKKPKSQEPQSKQVVSKPQEPKSLTLEHLHQQIEALRQVVLEHTNQIAQLQEALARKRKPPTSSSKVQIRDKQTGKVYPSKNNCYQSLLKTGKLKDLVDRGILGSVPEKNTFGWYVLVREWPDRFEEVKPEHKT